MDPVYSTRRQRLTLGLVNILAGLLLWNVVPLLGHFLIIIGLLMILSGVLRGTERIA